MMYWTDSVTGNIQQANLDGSGVEDLVTGLLGRPQGIALDMAGGKMYWADSSASSKPRRVNTGNTKHT